MGARGSPTILAATGIDLLTDPALLAKAHAFFKSKTSGPYRSPIPAGQKVPLPAPTKADR